MKHLTTARDQRSDLSEENGVGASGGWLNGRDVYEWVDFITDETSDPLDPADGAVGFLDRWIGNGNPGYEDAITYFEGVMVGYGLDVKFIVSKVEPCGQSIFAATKQELFIQMNGWSLVHTFDIAPYATPQLQSSRDRTTRVWYANWRL